MSQTAVIRSNVVRRDVPPSNMEDVRPSSNANNLPPSSNVKKAEISSHIHRVMDGTT